ncbi:hypothetical protein PISL3812_04136 [Talaromyces islandicus]|uniref:SAP domain-containing protein n=1 Tax=Talaromyces islandicus TaxID=28573 RepID=A0A0U1LWT8_TALIS|nr:hypothetical protein PISL3812_04136 [Talaromyces islandicus]
MADYNKWKVTELKAELKRRGVPQTGLKLKQDFVNKLTELDSEAHDEPAPEEDSARQPPSEQKEDDGIADEAKPKEGETQVPPQSATDALPTQDAPSTQKPDQDQANLDDQPVSKPEDNVLEADQPDKRDEHPQDEQPVAAEPEAKEQEINGLKKHQDFESREETEVPTTETAAEAPAPLAVEPSSSAPSEPENEMRKRKRRSRSPAPTEETVKKSKVDNENPRVVLKEDESSATATPAAEPAIIPQSRTEVETTEEKREYAQQSSGSRLEKTKYDDSPERRDLRFRELLPPNKKRKRTPSPGLSVQPDEREVEPALHPATSAIYIRDLMRPLQPTSLKRYLTSLASSDNDPEVLLDFFLDPIKTHCFALFKSVSAASQVRSRVHGAPWPNERDRKPLWADFIPENKVGDWIKTEQESASQARAGPRWEVVYEQTEYGFEASLQEYRGTTTGPTPAPRQSIDTGPRRESQPSGPPQSSSQQRGKGFKALDELFLSTTTKPKLYYLPVSRDVIERRLERFAALSQRGSQHRQSGRDDTRRITFEDVDVFVDGGPEYGLARSRGGRRPGRGAWRGRAR